MQTSLHSPVGILKFSSREYLNLAHRPPVGTLSDPQIKTLCLSSLTMILINGKEHYW